MQEPLEQAYIACPWKSPVLGGSRIACPWKSRERFIYGQRPLAEYLASSALVSRLRLISSRS